jgi:hypothetical protein
MKSPDNVVPAKATAKSTVKLNAKYRKLIAALELFGELAVAVSKMDAIITTQSTDTGTYTVFHFSSHRDYAAAKAANARLHRLVRRITKQLERVISHAESERHV